MSEETAGACPECNDTGMIRLGDEISEDTGERLGKDVACLRCDLDVDALHAERDRLRAALRPFCADWIAEYADEGESAGADLISPPLPIAVWRAVRAAFGEPQHGPRSACPECGMGGDVGADTPNPIPF